MSTPPLPTAPLPVMLTGDEMAGVVDAAAVLTACLVDGDALVLLDVVKRVNPALAERLRDLTDSVMTLDARTGFMAGTYPTG